MENLSQSRFGPFLIDVRERVLERDGQPVPLTPKAFDLLAALLEQPGRLISKEELLQKVWPDTFVEESNLAYNVFALRKALGDPAENGQYIGTVPKRGYRFTASVTPVDPANEEPAPPSRLTTSVPREVEKTILPFLRKDLVRRHQTMADVKVVLEELESDSSGTARRQAPPRFYPFSKRWGLFALAPLLAAAVYFAAQSRRVSSEPLRALPLTSLQGVVRSPSLSPDGNYVVFTWSGPKQDNPDLYVQQVGAGSPLQLTTDPGIDYSPSWSPDGRTIAFLRREPTGLKSEVRLMAPLGGSERKVADIQPRMPFYRPISLAWCPDSACVLVTDSPGAGKSDAVFVIALGTGEKRQLTHSDGQVVDADPAISPDGRSLIFRRDSTPFSGAFHRLPLKSGIVPDGEAVRVTSTLSAGKPVWMPNSRELLFAAQGWLWKLDALNGGTPTRLPFVGQDAVNPSVSRTADGRQRLVYVRSFADRNVWRVDASDPGAPAASPPVAAISSTRADYLANLSPDGRRLVFLSDRSGEPQLWVADTDGSNPLQLTSLAFSSSPGFPRWSPRGDLIAFHGDPHGRPDVILVSEGGGQPHTLTTSMANGGFPSFSRDGRWIYFCVVQATEARIWKMPSPGGAAVQVTHNAGTIAIESRDGRDLYYLAAVNRPSSLWRIPVAGGAPVKLLDGVFSGNFDVVDGGIYYIDRVSGEADVLSTGRSIGETRLQYFDFATQRSTIVAHNLGAVGFGLSVSADGRTVFFSRVDSSVDELMSVENFR